MNTNNNTTVFTMRINSTLLEKISLIAKENKRSKARQIEFMLEQQLKENHNELT